MFHQKDNHGIKRFISLTISLLFLLQTTLQAYTPTNHKLDLEKTVLSTTLNTGSTTLTAGESILLQAVKGKVNNLSTNAPSVILQSLNNVSYHSHKTTTTGILTTTSTMKGSNIETIVGTELVVGGNFIINGEDLTAELYDGVLTSQATREDPAKAKEKIQGILLGHIDTYVEGANEDTPYSGYSNSAIETIQTQAVHETWDESTTSLNALGQIVVQAIVAATTFGAGNAILAGTTVANSVIVTAAVQSVVNQLATELLTAVITGESLNIDLKSLVTGAVKSAVFAGVTNALDTEMFGDVKDSLGEDIVDKDGVLNTDALSYTQKAIRNITHASVSTVIHGGDFKDNIIAAVGDSVAAPAFNHIGHTLTGKDGLKLDPNDLSTKALITTSHALVGGTIAELTGGEFSSGAVASAVGHVVGEYTKDVLLSGITKDSSVSQEKLMEQVKAISKAVGGATVLLTQENVSDEELARATAMAGSVAENNALFLIPIAFALLEVADAGLTAYDTYRFAEAIESGDYATAEEIGQDLAIGVGLGIIPGNKVLGELLKNDTIKDTLQGMGDNFNKLTDYVGSKFSVDNELDAIGDAWGGRVSGGGDVGDVLDFSAYNNISTAKSWQATSPRDLNEQILWNDIVKNPSSGKDLKLDSDARFARSEGWSKRARSHELPDGTSIDIHYQYNSNTKKAYDIKIDTPKRSSIQPGISIVEDK